MHLAVQWGDKQVLQQLFTRGGDVNLPDHVCNFIKDEGMSCAHLILHSSPCQRGRTPIFHILLHDHAVELYHLLVNNLHADPLMWTNMDRIC